MPAVALAGVASAISSVAAGGLAATLATNLVVGLATTALSRAFAPKPKRPSFTQEAQGRSTLVRSSIEGRKIIYGEARTAGDSPQFFVSDSGLVSVDGLSENIGVDQRYGSFNLELDSENYVVRNAVQINEGDFSVTGNNNAWVKVKVDESIYQITRIGHSYQAGSSVLYRYFDNPQLNQLYFITSSPGTGAAIGYDLYIKFLDFNGIMDDGSRAIYYQYYIDREDIEAGILPTGEVGVYGQNFRRLLLGNFGNSITNFTKPLNLGGPGILQISGEVDLNGVKNGTFKSTSKNQFLHQVTCIAGHEIEDITEIKAEDEILTYVGNFANNDRFKVKTKVSGDSSYIEDFSGSEWSLSFINTSTGEVLTEPNAQLIRTKIIKGSTGQSADANAVDEIESWTESHKGSDVAYVYNRLQYHGNKYPNGIPEFRYTVKGKKCFDPRTGLIQWTDNPALCIRDYLTNSTYGFGASEDEIDEATIIASANLCDELVDIDKKTLDENNNVIITPAQEKRYTCNGILNREASKIDNLNELVSSFAGAVTFTAGKFRVLAGGYNTPVVDVDAFWLRDSVNLQPRQSRQNLVNKVSAVYIDPEKDWQPTTAPAVKNTLYISQDGGFEYKKELSLNFTTSSNMSQRISKIILEKTRQGIIAELKLNMRGLVLEVWDVITLTIEQLGWNQKIFRVLEYKNNISGGGIDIKIQEESQESYNWNKGEASLSDPAPDTQLPNPAIISPPLNISLNSGTDVLQIRLDGSIFSRIKVNWMPPDDVFVTTGGFQEIEYKQSTSSEWERWGVVAGDVDSLYILDVRDGVEYDIRIRAINSAGVRSEWTTSNNHFVIGKTEPPADVQKFNVIPEANNVVLKWEEVTDIDLSGYEIRFGSRGSIWDSMTTLTKTTKGTNITSASIPPNYYDFAIKAVDTSKNFSTNAKFARNVLLTSDFNIVQEEKNATLWIGSKTNMIRNPLFGYLEPEDARPANENNYDLFDNYVVERFSDYTYISPEYDLGVDLPVRLNSKLDINFNPSESTTYEIQDLAKYRESTGSFGAYEETLTIGFVLARYYQFRISLNPDLGLPYIKNYDNILDTRETKENGNVFVPAGGITVFTQNEYFTKGKVLATPQGVSDGYAPVVTNVTTNSFYLTLYRASASKSGDANWEYTGVAIPESTL